MGGLIFLILEITTAMVVKFISEIFTKNIDFFKKIYYNIHN